MSSENSFGLYSSAKSTNSVIENKSEKTPQDLVNDLRQCLKEKAFLHSQFYYSLSNYPEWRTSIQNTNNDEKFQQQQQQQPSTLTEANLHLHNENINSEMKKQFSILNQPVYKNINYMSKSFLPNFKQQQSKNIKNFKLKNNFENNINNITTQQTSLKHFHRTSAEEKKKYNSTDDIDNNKSVGLFENDTVISHDICEKLQSKNKESQSIMKIEELQRNNIKAEKYISDIADLNYSINNSNIINNEYKNDNNREKCSLQQYDATGRVQEINLDNIRHKFNQKKQKQSNMKSGVSDIKNDTDTQCLSVNKYNNNNNIKLRNNDRSNFGVTRENSLVSLIYPDSVFSSKSVDSSTSLPVNFNFQYKNKTFNGESNYEKNSYHEHAISSSITVNRDRRQHINTKSSSSSSNKNNKNNNNIKTDDILNQSSDTIETLKEKVYISTKKNKNLKEYFRIFQPNRQQGPLITKRKLDLFENFTTKKFNSKIRFKQQKNKILNTNYRIKNLSNDYKSFPSVENLIKMYTTQQQQQQQQQLEGKKIDEKIIIDSIQINEISPISNDGIQNRISPVSDEGCQIERLSRSDSEENITKSPKIQLEKVARSISHDSALGLDEEIACISFNERRKSTESIVSPKSFHKRKNLERRNTLTISDIPLRTALLPLPQPTDLPDTSVVTSGFDMKDKHNIKCNQQHHQAQTNIPSKVLIEERIVEIPSNEIGLLNISRRESAQSCSSEYTNSSEYGAKRFVRTPSVVVSDYSDDVMCGITLEEIEYFQKHRMRRRSSGETATTEKDDALSDVSGASSCSNLYYCGSTISALDGADCYINGIRTKIQRKNSDSSICSNSPQISCDEDEEDGVGDDQNCYNSSEDIFHIDNLQTNNYKSDTESRKKV